MSVLQIPLKGLSRKIMKLTLEVGTISVIAIVLRNNFASLHNALYLWRIVIASNSYRFRLFAGVMASIVIALSLQVSVIASLRYCFDQHMQLLSLLGM